MHVIGRILIFALEVYWWIIIIEVVISWLTLFGVLNISHPKAQALVALLRKATDPVLKPLRKVIPPVSGLDLSPLIVIFGIILLQHLLYLLFF